MKEKPWAKKTLGWFQSKVDSIKNRGDVNERRPSLDARPEAHDDQLNMVPDGARELEAEASRESETTQFTFGSKEVVVPRTVSSFPVLVWREGPKDAERSIKVKTCSVPVDGLGSVAKDGVNYEAFESVLTF